MFHVVFPEPDRFDHLRAELLILNSGSSTHGRFAGQSVAPTTQEVLVPARKNAPLFKFLQQRSINGCKSGEGIDCPHFLASLVERQLLLPKELDVLSRAVVTGECVIEPALCRSSRGIDALRVLSAFLMVLDKTPGLKQELEDFIAKAPVAVMPPKARHIFDGYSMAGLQRLQDELKTVLAKYDGFIDTKRSSPVFCEQQIRQYLKGLLDKHISRIDRFRCLTGLRDSLKTEKDHMLLRNTLAQLIDHIGQGLRCGRELDGRIDSLPMDKVLPFNSQFSGDIISLGCMRGLSQEGTCCRSYAKMDELSDYPCLYGKYYVDIVQYTRVDDDILSDAGFSPLDMVKKRPKYIWVNYQGIFLEFHLPGEPECYRISQTEPDDSDALFTAIIREAILPRLFPGMWKYKGLAECRWLIDLPVELYKKWLNERGPEVDQASALALLNKKIWDCEYSKLDDLQWLISVLARSGLRPKAGQDYSEGVSLFCPNCSFCAEVIYSPRFRDIFGLVVLQGEFIKLMLKHKKDNKECSVAQTIEPEALWSERNHSFEESHCREQSALDVFRALDEQSSALDVFRALREQSALDVFRVLREQGSLDVFRALREGHVP